jgi:putative addiction module antidote
VVTSKVKLIPIEDSLALELPKEVLDHLRVGEGDTLYLTETVHGVHLSSVDTEFLEDMAIAEIVMREDHDVLRKLAE